MPDESAIDLEDSDTPSNLLSANAHWIFGSIYAVLVLAGFIFGIWTGAQKPKPTEVTETKQKENTEKPGDKPAPKPPSVTPPPSQPQPQANGTNPQPKPKDTPVGVTPPQPEVKGVGLKEVVAIASAVHAGVSKPVVKAVSFKEVLPILQTYCFECHGGSTGKPKGDVDVTSVAKMLKSKGPPLVPGKPEDSTMYTSTASGDMPKDKKGPNSMQLKLLHDWIASGAKERRAIRRRKMRGTDDSQAGIDGGRGSGVNTPGVVPNRLMEGLSR
ncbi:MAG: hypothetical protein L0241_14565 [Planctomycetia bacterium]|nr:hypothetical protein [Planctomycetia bacterium]